MDINRFYSRLLTLITGIYTATAIAAQDTPLPYFCGFEKDEPTTAEWVLPSNYHHQTKFVAGKALHNLGEQALYTTLDDGVTHGYKFEMSTGWVIACYKTFTLPAGEYNILFDYLADVDDRNDLDVMKVALVPESEGTRFTSDTKEFPKTIDRYELTDDKGRKIFGASDWSTVKIIGQRITEPGNYNLVFAFRNAEPLTHKRGGVAIDNLQLVQAVTDENACNIMPHNIRHTKSTTGVHIQWDGNAPEYEVEYYLLNYNDVPTTSNKVTVQTNEYTLSHFANPEGPYMVKIRALCTDLTVSPQVGTEVIYLYDPTKYALDYLDLSNTAVAKCYTGNFANPAETEGVMNDGPYSTRSMHTIHHDTTAYDRLTGYGLRTVKPGMNASVRLGSWAEGTATGTEKIKSGRMEYIYTVPADKNILLFHYAAVMQFAKNHDKPEEQTSIKIDVLRKNKKGEWISEGYCSRADFNSWDIAGGAYSRPWQTFWPNDIVTDTDKSTNVLNTYTQGSYGDKMPIYWLDWQVLGVDMSHLVGEEVMIRITMSACVADFHFAYCYFAIECIKKAIEGESCTGKATDFYAPEGFNYRWYNTTTGEEVADRTTRHFEIAENDTNDYTVQLTFLEPDAEINGCYFNLNAHTLPRLPESRMRYDVKMTDDSDHKQVTLYDESVVNRYWKGDTIPENRESITRVLWSCDEYDITPNNDKIALIDNIPLEGDTFTITLTSWVNNCEDTKEFTIEVPSYMFVREDSTVCFGESIRLNGQYFTHDTILCDTAININLGIDVITEYHLNFYKTDTVLTDTSTCTHQLPYKWSIPAAGIEKEITETGHYEYPIPGSLACDSMLYILNLKVASSLELITDPLPEICGDDSEFDITYTVTAGDCAGYTLEFNKSALDAGFENIEFTPDTSTTGRITIPLPENVLPNHYEAVLTYSNYACGNIEETLRFDILYPSSVITQRWNDVLALQNAENNGGYTFSGYQWYLNGQPIEGHTLTQTYEEGKLLDFEGEYRMLLTRSTDGVSVMTCPFTPTRFDESSYLEISTVTFSGGTAEAKVPQQAKARIYSISGVLHSEFDLTEGTNSIRMPETPGIYIMKIVYSQGNQPSEIVKLVIK